MESLKQQMQALASPKPRLDASSKRPGGWHLCGGSDDTVQTGPPQQDNRKQIASQLALTVAEQQAQNAQRQLADLQQQYQQCQQVSIPPGVR